MKWVCVAVESRTIGRESDFFPGRPPQKERASVGRRESTGATRQLSFIHTQETATGERPRPAGLSSSDREPAVPMPVPTTPRPPEQLICPGRRPEVTLSAQHVCSACSACSVSSYDWQKGRLRRWRSCWSANDPREPPAAYLRPPLGRSWRCQATRPLIHQKAFVLLSSRSSHHHQYVARCPQGMLAAV